LAEALDLLVVERIVDLILDHGHEIVGYPSPPFP
jgi:hypothetical protein